MSPVGERRKMVDSVAGEARSSAASCTNTSYCSPFCSKRVTWRPPSSVSSVRPTTVTSTPEVGHLGAVHLDAELGHVELQVGLDAFQARIGADPLQHQVDVLLQLLVGARRLDDELDRPRRPALAERAGLLAEACTPAMRRSLGLISALICCCERVRSSQSFSRPMAWKRDTSGLPLMTRVDSISGTLAMISPACRL